MVLLTCLLGFLASLTVDGFAIVSRPQPRPSMPPIPSLKAKTSNDDIVSQYQVTIDFCAGCRWGMRSFWMAQELLTTFQDDAALQAVTLLPSRPPAPGGAFVVKCFSSNGDEAVLWDRATEGGFPEIKNLKQLVRDHIDPGMYLGHSDRFDRQDEADATTAIPTALERDDLSSTSLPTLSGVPSESVVTVTYCTGCKWLLRAAYMGLELLSTFDKEINALSLIPSRPPSKGGEFSIAIDGSVVWDRSTQGGFPGIPELKQLVRDKLVPTKDLGHSDVATMDNVNTEEIPSNLFDEKAEAYEQLPKEIESAEDEIAATVNTEEIPSDLFEYREQVSKSSDDTKTEADDKGKIVNTEEVPSDLFEEMDSDEAEKARKYYGVI